MRNCRIPLDSRHILRTAVQFADEHGLNSLSMRRLASELGVEAMSLYHHIKNKDELLDEMVEQIFQEFKPPVPGQDWYLEMVRRSQAMRQVMLHHRWALGLIESRAHPGPATLEHHNAVLGTLRAAGFTVPQAAHAFALLDSFIYGFVLQELSVPFSTGDEAADLAQSILSHMAPDEYPHLVELAREHVLQPNYNFGDEFATGLKLILDGLATMRDRR
ncbi:MAG: TetR/AcrR family transcriptional regulator [Spirochaeta sp.]|nr:TetR/AcrR family transcriptional regulator [Spirochaeta sp.]